MRLILFSILLLTEFSDEYLIMQIHNEYDLINKSLDSYKVIENKDVNVYKDLNSDNYSFESVDINQLAIINLIRYYDTIGIRKAIAKFEGDRQNLISEYYYKNDSLIFVFKTRIDYKKPKWSDDFNETDKNVIENRYYFNKNELIKWIDSNKMTVDLSLIDKIISKKIISDSEIYKEYQ